ncbi:MAG: TIGR04282 family arsenosugar biosynthesis glycosyltransferase [Nocardioides sp.]
MTPRMLVVAKAPVAGRVKTRLGADVGMALAADLAAASLLDSLRACREAVGAEHCHLSLDGDLADAARADELRAATAGWTVHRQHGEGFDERLVRAHLDTHLEARGHPGGPVVQIGMDTPQVTPALLLAAAAATAGHDAALGPAEDGGWWVLALRDPRYAAALGGVPMSTPTTHDDTRAALIRSGASVTATATLRDVDTVADADAVAADAPASEFARAWRGVRPEADAR